MRLPSRWRSSNRGPTGSNRWITRRPPDADGFSRRVQALRELYESPRLQGISREQR